MGGQTCCLAAPRNMPTVSRLLLLLLGASLVVAEVAGGTCQCLDQCLAELGDVVVPAEGPTKHRGKYVLKEQKYYCRVPYDGSCPDAVFSGGQAISYKACESYVPPPANARPDKEWKTGCGPEGLGFPWVKYKKACYMVVKNVKKTWDEARKHCGWHLAHVASISSAQEEEFIQSVVGHSEKKFWIGGKRDCQVSYVNQFPMRVCDDFSWSDGTPWTFNRLNPLPVSDGKVEAQTPPAFLSVDRLDLRENNGGFRRRSPQQKTLPSVSVYGYDECVLWGKAGWEPTKCDEGENHFICKY